MIFIGMIFVVVIVLIVIFVLYGCCMVWLVIQIVDVIEMFVNGDYFFDIGVLEWYDELGVVVESLKCFWENGIKVEELE